MNHIIFLNPKELIPTQPLESSMRMNPQFIGNSIVEYGFKENFPIMIFKYGGKYYINNGHHRVIASIWADLSLVPCEKLNIKEIEFEYDKIFKDFVKENLLPKEDLDTYFSYLSNIVPLDKKIKKFKMA